jgi:dihydrofolate synthase / folylpolyglutamate synthase
LLNTALYSIFREFSINALRLVFWTQPLIPDTELMRFNSLKDWLSWQETLHPTEIELGLGRVAEVLVRLALKQPNFRLITVAGTNGKGSSVAMLESILLAAGYKVGSYTSPHLLQYNERIKINGQAIDDASLCASFARIDDARMASPAAVDGAEISAQVSLSYFEFGTLAAIDILQRADIDIAILEVGLGGRLDAVNVLDADVALITALDVDHPDWLGVDRETIAREKAGIMRTGRVAICADPQPPASLVAVAQALKTPLQLLGADFHLQKHKNNWHWQQSAKENALKIDNLPFPALLGAFQLNNAAGVLAVLAALKADFPVSENALHQGLQTVSLPGRYQLLDMPVGTATHILDVAHNAQSAHVLADNLLQQGCEGRTLAVLGMLADKDINAVLEQLVPVVDVWYVAPLPAGRSASAAQLRTTLLALGVEKHASIESFDDVSDAYQAALAISAAPDRIVVTGSFYTVAAVLGKAV